MNFDRLVMTDRRDQVAARLRYLPEVWGFKSAQAFADTLATSKSNWGNWISPTGDVEFTLNAALKLYQAHRIPVEWVFLNDWGIIRDDDVRLKLLQCQAKIDEEQANTSRRHSSGR